MKIWKTGKSMRESGLAETFFVERKRYEERESTLLEGDFLFFLNKGWRGMEKDAYVFLREMESISIKPSSGDLEAVLTCIHSGKEPELVNLCREDSEKETAS